MQALQVVLLSRDIVSLCFEKEKRNLHVFPDCLLERRISWLRHTMPEEIIQKFFPLELFGVGAPTGMLFQFSQAVEPCKTPNEKNDELCTTRRNAPFCLQKR